MVVGERLPFGRRFLCGKKASDVHVVSEITVIATCIQVAGTVDPSKSPSSQPMHRRF